LIAISHVLLCWIIDASFVVAPRQRNTREENKAIKEGRGSELWNDKPHKKSHKDVDARWTEKRGEKFYGYKMHAKADQRHKMVLKYDTTSANVHDSKGYEPLLDESDEGKELYLDAGYESQEPIVERHRMKPVICEKGHRNHPLTDEQKKKNREKSKTRCLVEHVFGFMEQSMCGLIFLTEYTRTDLKNEIKSSIEELRKSTIEYKEYGNNKPRLLEELQDSITIEQLANYCSAYTTPSPSSNRARLMPIICGLYNIEYKTIVIPQVSQDEPDLFTSAFNFLVDNTMYMISMKPASWLTDEDNHESNLNLLINFVSVFTETKDEQHLKKLDDYGIIPNQLNEVNKVRDLKKNVSIDDDLQQIYKNIFQKDLKTSFVKKDFESFYDFKEYEPKDVGDEIEKELKQRNYEGTDIIYIIDKLNNGKWVDYFPNIEDKKEDIYYKHGTKEDKEAIYHIQMLGSEKIKLIADLSKSKDFEAIINKAKDLRFQQQERERQFQFTYTIGKHIENIIRNEVNKELSCDEKLLADDIQDGQDMVISYKGHDLYYLECKAKWNFSEPAHMSSLQIKQAVRKIGHYALCCIDCTDSGCKVSANASENDVEEAQDDIIANTYVNNNIGYAFKSIVSSLIQQEDDSTIKEDDTIKVHGDLSCNISKKVFKNGMPFAKFIEQLKSDLERACNEINQQSVKYQ
jgi:IS5 family transposase